MTFDRLLEHRHGSIVTWFGLFRVYLVKEQLVEADAWVCAQVIRNKIRELSPEQTDLAVGQIQSGGEQAGYSEWNPQKGAVFDQIERQRLPEDFEQKIVETWEGKEDFEVEEYRKMTEQVAPFYENCKAIAMEAQGFDTWKEHFQVEGGYIEKVHDKTLEAEQVLAERFAKEALAEGSAIPVEGHTAEKLYTQ